MAPREKQCSKCASDGRYGIQICDIIPWKRHTLQRYLGRVTLKMEQPEHRGPNDMQARYLAVEAHTSRYKLLTSPAFTD